MGMGTLLVLLTAFLLLLPKLIDLEPVRQKVLAELSEKVGGQVRYQGADLSLLPRPRLVLHQGTISVPGKIKGTLEATTIYPRILPLLRGKLRISSLRVVGPHLDVNLPEGPEKRAKPRKGLSLTALKERVAPVLALVALRTSGLLVKVERGRLNLNGQRGPVFRFSDINARIGLTPYDANIDITCKSNLWQGFSLKGLLDIEAFKGKGQIEVTQFRPQALTGYILPRTPIQVAESQMNLSLGFQADGIDEFQAELEGSIPFLTLVHGNKGVVMRGKGIKGAFRVDRDKATISLIQLDLDYPRLTMRGRLQTAQTSPRVSLHLEGSQVDVSSVREAALTMGGDDPVTRELFSIVKGGQVPLIILEMRGSSLADLLDLENIRIKGQIIEGRIFVPEAELNLEEVNGSVVISEGILEGKDLEARLGKSRGHQGKLKLGLAEQDNTFHLDAIVQADLAELPPILRRIVENRALVEEIGLIEDIEGKAKGRLVLGESTSSIQTRVDVSEFSLSAKYRRIPYPLAVSGGQFSLKEDNLSLANLDGKLGNSGFSQLSASLDWEGRPYLGLKSRSISIFLEEIYPWVSSLKTLPQTLKEISSLRGHVTLNNLELKGPLLRPPDWRLKTGGRVKDLAVNSALLPGMLTISGGELEADPRKLTLRNAQAEIMDARLRLTGVLEGYTAGLNRLETTLSGNMGPDAVRWASSLANLPPEISPRPPLSISRAHLIWERGAEVSFAGDLGVAGGGDISLDLLKGPNGLEIKRLTIKDEESDAFFKLHLQEGVLGVGFTGNLVKTTLDGLLSKNIFLTGWIKGDLDARIFFDHPAQSTVEGKFQGGGLDFPGLNLPVKIEGISLNAHKRRLNVESAKLDWHDSHMVLNGGIDFSEKGILLDMALSSDGLDWDTISKTFNKGAEQRGKKRAKGGWSLPLRGVVHLKSEHFKYGEFTWSPFHCDMHLGGEEVRITVKKASLCGISTPGILEFSPDNVRLDLRPIAKGQDLHSTISCLPARQYRIDGSFGLEGELIAEGIGEGLARSLRGSLEFVAKDGRIYHFGLLAKILALINITEILKGRLPDLQKEGFAYNSIILKGNLKDGKLRLKEGILDGSCMNLACRGDIDLVDKDLDLTVMVAPFKTIDSVVKKIPLVGHILDGTLISIPVKVEGSIADPKVTPLPPAAVGSGLLGIMRRTLELPVKVIQPVLPKEKKEQLDTSPIFP